MAEIYRGFEIPEQHINGHEVVPEKARMLPIARRPITSSDQLTIFVQAKVPRGTVKS